MLRINNLNGFGAGGAETIEATYCGAASGTPASTSFTSSSINIGTADAGRLVVVAISRAYALSADASLTSVTIGGVSATELLSEDINGSTSAKAAVSFYAAVVPTDTTAAVAVTASASVAIYGVAMWTILNAQSSTPRDTLTNEVAGTGAVVSGTIDAIADGVVLAACAQIQINVTETFTWSGATEQLDALAGSSGSVRLIHTAADHQSTTGENGRTVSATSTQAGRAIVLCSVSFR